eukprot:2953091-Prymnesium_polylepis.1
MVGVRAAGSRCVCWGMRQPVCVLGHGTHLHGHGLVLASLLLRRSGSRVELGRGLARALRAHHVQRHSSR